MANESILLVDDEEDIRELIEYNLARQGYAVTSVATGEDALKSDRAIIPNMVLLDLMLPGVDGLEVCKILKNAPSTCHMPVVMLTAKGEEADIVSGLAVSRTEPDTDGTEKQTLVQADISVKF